MKQFIRQTAAVLSLVLVLTSVDVTGALAVRAEEIKQNTGVLNFNDLSSGTGNGASGSEETGGRELNKAVTAAPGQTSDGKSSSARLKQDSAAKYAADSAKNNGTAAQNRTVGNSTASSTGNTTGNTIGNSTGGQDRATDPNSSANSDLVAITKDPRISEKDNQDPKETDPTKMLEIGEQPDPAPKAPGYYMNENLPKRARFIGPDPTEQTAADDQVQTNLKPGNLYSYTMIMNLVGKEQGKDDKLNPFYQPYQITVGEDESALKEAGITYQLPEMNGYKSPNKAAGESGTALQNTTDGHKTITFDYDNVKKLAEKGKAEGDENVGQLKNYVENFNYEPQPITFKVQHMVQSLAKQGEFELYNGQVGESEIKASVGEVCTIQPLDALKDGYEEVEKNMKALVPDAKDFVVKKYYIRKRSNVIYDTDGGNPISSRRFAFGQTIPLPKDPPVKDGYEFLGWKVGSDLGSYKKYKKDDVIGKDVQQLDGAMPGHDVEFVATWKGKEKAPYKVTYWLEKADYTVADKEDPVDSFAKTHAFLYEEEKPEVPITTDLKSKFEALADEALNIGDESKFPSEHLGADHRRKGFLYDAATTKKLNNDLKIKNPTPDGKTNVQIVLKRKRYTLIFCNGIGNGVNTYTFAPRWSDKYDAEGNRLLSSDPKIAFSPPLNNPNPDKRDFGKPPEPGYNTPYQFVARFGQETIGLWPIPLFNCKLDLSKDFFGWLGNGNYPYLDTPPYKFDSFITDSYTYNKVDTFGHIDNSVVIDLNKVGNNQDEGNKEYPVLNFNATSGTGHAVHVEFKIQTVDQKGYEWNYRGFHYYKFDTDGETYDFPAPSLKGFTAETDYTTDEGGPAFRQTNIKKDDVKGVRDYLHDQGMPDEVIESRLKEDSDYWHGRNNTGMLITKYNRNKYNLILHNGKETKELQLPYEANINEYLPKDPSAEKAGYPKTWKFVSWTLDPGNKTDVPKTGFTMPDYNVQVYAKWKDPNIYNFTIDLNKAAAPAAKMDDLQQAEVTNATFDNELYKKEDNSPKGSFKDPDKKMTFFIKSGFKVNELTQKPTCPGYTFLGWRVLRYQIDPQTGKADLTKLITPKPGEQVEYFAFGNVIGESCVAQAMWIKNEVAPVRYEHHFFDKQDNELGAEATTDQTNKDGMKGFKGKGLVYINPNGRPDSQIAGIGEKQDENWVLIASPKTLKKVKAQSENKYIQSLMVKKFPEGQDNPNVFKFYYQPFKKRFYYKKFICDNAVNADNPGVQPSSSFEIMDPDKVKNNNHDFDTCNFKKIPGFLLAKEEKKQKSVKFTLNKETGDIEKINGKAIKPNDPQAKIGVEFHYTDARVLLRNSDAENIKTPKGYHRVVIDLAKTKMEFAYDYVGSHNKEGKANVKENRSKYVVDVADGYKDENIPIPDVVPVRELPVHKIWLDQNGLNIYSGELYEDPGKAEEDLEADLDEAVVKKPVKPALPIMKPAAATITLSPVDDYTDANGNKVRDTEVKMSADDLKLKDEQNNVLKQPYWEKKAYLPIGTPLFVERLGDPQNSPTGPTPRTLKLADFASCKKDDKSGDVAAENQKLPAGEQWRAKPYLKRSLEFDAKQPWNEAEFERLRKLDGRKHEFFKYNASEKNATRQTDGREVGVFVEHEVSLRDKNGAEVKRLKLFDVDVVGSKAAEGDTQNSIDDMKQLVVVNAEVPTIDVEVQKSWYDYEGKSLDFNTLSVGSAVNPKPLTMEMRFLDPVVAKNLPTRSTDLTAAGKWHGWIRNVRVRFRRKSDHVYAYNLHEVGEDNGLLSYGGKKFVATYIGRCLDGFKVFNHEKINGFPPVVAICDCARMGMNKAYSAMNQVGAFVEQKFRQLFGRRGLRLGGAPSGGTVSEDAAGSSTVGGEAVGGCQSCHLD